MSIINKKRKLAYYFRNLLKINKNNNEWRKIQDEKCIFSQQKMQTRFKKQKLSKKKIKSNNTLNGIVKRMKMDYNNYNIRN